MKRNPRRFYGRARGRGSRDWRRVYRTGRGRIVWSGVWGGILVRSRKASPVLVGLAQRREFIAWAEDRGLEWDTIEVSPRRTDPQLPANPANLYPSETHYSPHFAKRELRCKCGCKPSAEVERNLTKLANDLERVRAEYGEPMPILSGHRCAAYNATIKGAARFSKHISGEAVDFARPNEDLWTALQMVPAFRNGGMSRYGGRGMHADNRTDGPARW